MRYAFISDIHANVQAWDAVLKDICERDVNDIICLGDIVGYGPHPAEVLESVRHYTDKIVLGNHDAAVCGMVDASNFYGEAQNVVNWTAKRLDREALDFLKEIPLCIASEEFRVAHADFVRPGAFDYLEDETTARASWAKSTELLMFIGHTHLPAVHMLSTSGEYSPMRAEGFLLKPGCRYIVNVGSVGMSRDGDYRASYCIYDDVLRSISWQRIDFDMKALKRDSDKLLGSNEQIDFLFKDYANREEKKTEAFLDSKVFLTTQDLTSLIQEFEPSRQGEEIMERRTKKVVIKRKSSVVHKEEPKESKKKDKPEDQRWKSRTERDEALANQKLFITLIIIGSVLFLLIAGAILKSFTG